MLSTIVPHSLKEVESLIRDSSTSLYEDYGSFKLFIVRKAEITRDNLNFSTETYIINSEKKEVYNYDPKNNKVEKLPKAFQSFLRRMEKLYNNNQKIINTYSQGVENLEDYLYARSTPSYFMDMWFDLKRVLSKLENYYYRNSVVYREFFKDMEGMFGDWWDEFKDIEENISFQISNINTMISRLDGVYNYFESIKADRLNKTLLSLTVISGIFLPLNLIVGFFGMNTPGLYFLEDKQGTQKVLMILGGVLLTFLIGFKVVRLIDRYLLRFILGRYNFYKNITSKLEDFNSRMHGR